MRVNWRSQNEFKEKHDYVNRWRNRICRCVRRQLDSESIRLVDVGEVPSAGRVCALVGANWHRHCGARGA